MATSLQIATKSFRRIHLELKSPKWSPSLKSSHPGQAGKDPVRKEPHHNQRNVYLVMKKYQKLRSKVNEKSPVNKLLLRSTSKSKFMTP